MDHLVDGRTRVLLGCCLAIFLSGCDNSTPEPPKPTPTPLGEAFDPTTTGTITGQVIWEGSLPTIPNFRAPICAFGDAAHNIRHEWPNPNAPVLGAPPQRGVASAVVYLGKVDESRSRPWDLPPVQVEMDEYQYHVLQGDLLSRIGFVRRGTEVVMVSRQPAFHAVRARGAAFFTLPFPDAEQPRGHSFTQPGVVELSSGTSYFWMRAYLFVSDHPYLTRTDCNGRFTLPQVPPGEYDLVCWHPNWNEKDHELDADSFLVSRLTYREPIQKMAKVYLSQRETKMFVFKLSMRLFDD